jgi:hypothetical protein
VAHTVTPPVPTLPQQRFAINLKPLIYLACKAVARPLLYALSSATPLNSNKHKSQEIPTMRYAHPGTEGAIVSFKAKYGNYIGGEFVAPVDGNYFTNTSPVNGKPIADFPRSTAKDIDKALDAAHAAADAWGKTSAQDRSLVLLKIADRIEQNL